MPDFDDSPSSEGATNVALHQRASEAPFAREVVNIQGDENPGKAIGFDQNGRLGAIVVYEDPFATVDNETQLDAALAADRSVVLRGEGVGGVIPMTTPKLINARFTEVKSDTGAHLRFNMVTGGSNLQAFTIHADDVTLRGFELSSTEDMTINNCFGVVFCDDPAHNHGHRLCLIDMHIHNWCRCVTKADTAPTTVTTAHEGCLFDRLYAHTFRDHGLLLDHGMHRLVMRDSRVIGKLAGENHHTNNGLHGGIRWEDNAFVNCVFANVDMMGFEATLGGYTNYHRRTRLHGCRAENTGSMGFSTMFGTGIVIEKCVAKNVKWIGFEIGGKPPEHTDVNWLYGQGILDGCEVDGVTPALPEVGLHYGQVTGISVNFARDTMIRGATRVSNVLASPDGAAGIHFGGSERCSVRGATLVDAGNAFIYFDLGPTPSSRGFHEVVGNTFRNPAGLGAHAVYVANTTVDVRNNILWGKSGTTMHYASNCIAPARVYVDGAPVAWSELFYPEPPAQPYYVPVPFAGSNLILPAGGADEYPPFSG